MFDFKYVLRGLGMIFQPGLKRYVILPLLISVLILSAFGWLAIEQFDATINWLIPQDSWLQWLNWLLWPLFVLTYLVLVFYGFTFVANLVGAPFNSKLAEAVVARLDDSIELPPSEPFFADVSKSIGSEIRKMLYYLVRAIPLLILILVPGIGPFASLLWLLFSIWFMALEYVAYPLENQKLLFKEQKSLLRKKPISALSFGGGATLLLLIPIVNLAAMPAAVAGASIYWYEKLRQTG
ncbi:MAG: sulfate transporter CysZ [Chromatiales bacterium]|jgi:CysZ protein